MIRSLDSIGMSSLKKNVVVSATFSCSGQSKPIARCQKNNETAVLILGHEDRERVCGHGMVNVIITDESRRIGQDRNFVARVATKREVEAASGKPVSSEKVVA